jgi:hypothetical protein
VEKTLDRPVSIPRLNPSHLIQIRRGFKQKSAKRRKETLALVLGNTDILIPNFLLFRDIYTGIFLPIRPPEVFGWRNPAPL